jgi:hypothetical protein
LVSAYEADLSTTRYLAICSREATGQSKLQRNDIQQTATSLFKINRMFRETTIETNIWKALQEETFEFDLSADPDRVRFDDKKSKKLIDIRKFDCLTFP